MGVSRHQGSDWEPKTAIQFPTFSHEGKVNLLVWVSIILQSCLRMGVGLIGWIMKLRVAENINWGSYRCEVADSLWPYGVVNH